MMIENVNVKNSNARSSTTYHIDDTISFADIIISKFSTKFKSFSEKEKATRKLKRKARRKKKSFKKNNKKVSR